MRPALLFLLLTTGPFAPAQIVLDSHFIMERFNLNAQADLLMNDTPERGFVMDNCEPVRDYALDEPHYWVKRVFHRIELGENPALSSIGPAHQTFSDVVNAAIDSGAVMYTDRDFSNPVPEAARQHVGASPVTIKVDFDYNDSLQALEQHIIGLGMLQADGQPVFLYFPELRWALKKYEVATPVGRILLSTFFDAWMFLSHPMEPVEDDKLPRWFGGLFPEQQSEFDALTSLFLLEHEVANRGVIRSGKRNVKVSSYAPTLRNVSVEFTPKGEIQSLVVKRGKGALLVANYEEGRPHGPFREFYGDGSLKQQGQFEHGLRVGEWVSWYANGNIHSRRIYVAGRLEGTQRAYYANGTLRLEYDMVHGDYEGDHKAYYSDGHLKSSGAMHCGFVNGDWSYSIRISDALKQYMDEHATSFDFQRTAWQDNFLDYRVTYTQTGSDSWNCPFRKCIDVVWPKVVE